MRASKAGEQALDSKPIAVLAAALHADVAAVAAVLGGAWEESPFEAAGVPGAVTVV